MDLIQHLRITSNAIATLDCGLAMLQMNPCVPSGLGQTAALFRVLKVMSLYMVNQG